ncbi:LacI family DNA-binding transcriptional regulator [Microbacterium sp. NPDC057944]|uniref:LacI family DNA-binding transcriptional regulator n=1 Tax=Microbacterium sp. NPDC057944 TaxID=3346286 RepID=UPI0036DE2D2E
MARAEKRRPTLADVAERSGMSKAAVSMILNDRPGSRLSAEAAEKVRKAASELGYRPNPAAQSLRLGKTRTIGFLSDQVTITRYASGMIRGVLDAAKQHGHTVLMAETGGGFEGASEALDAMLDRRVDGVIVGLMGARMVDIPRLSHDVPVVIVNGRTPLDHPSILPDERAAGRAVAGALVDAGHTRIGVIGDLPHVVADPRLTVTIGDRFAGLDEVFRGAGIHPVHVDVDGWHPTIGYEQTHLLLDRHPEITAILAGNDNVAFGVYQAAAERGLRIPHDLSVISFDDEELASYQRPGLTTARLPYEEMARLGVEMLIGDHELAHELVPMPLITRESVRDLRADPVPSDDSPTDSA